LLRFFEIPVIIARDFSCIYARFKIKEYFEITLIINLSTKYNKYTNANKKKALVL